jgi:4-deoxy-L-threo-5-hexosulose-uronate ketol-isomerase
MEARYFPDPVRFERMNTAETRESFLIESLFSPDGIDLVYSHADRAIIGSAVPVSGPLKMETSAELRSEYFCERREMGVINIGGDGLIVVDGAAYPLRRHDALYIGRGSREIIFGSAAPDHPSRYYLVSYPAHAAYPTTRAGVDAAEASTLGSDRECNRRTIRKYIHPNGIQSCQLVMGFTALEEGSIWNTMPPHTHERRSEVYLYFNLPEDSAVFHFMGYPRETRHIVVRNEQAVLSPSWSIHAGAGATNYSFIWAMGGENRDFADMDGVGLREMR